MNEAKVGMKVMLKSGGPELLVLRIIGASERHAKLDEKVKMKGYADEDVYCQWVVDERSGKSKEHAFKLCMLKPVVDVEITSTTTAPSLEENEPEEDQSEEDDFDFDF